jgi:transcriptional regulator with XRE-family HTH domain
MKVCEKIKLLRQTQGWSQEEMANKLGMSANGYGHIERGKTNLDLSRLEQIAQLFDIALTELFDSNEKNVFNLITAEQATSSQNTHNHFNIGDSNSENIQLKAELEKSQLLIEQQAKEITYLKEINALLKKEQP